MKISSLFTTVESLENEIQNFKEFRERYVDVISGRREPNDDDRELERLGVLSDVNCTLDGLLSEMKKSNKQ